MAPIAVGEPLPDGTLAYFDEQDQLQQVSVHSLAAGKKVILFGVPGMGQNISKNKSVKFLADGSAKYTHALGLELDLSEKGLGTRSRRFALLVDDLKVKAVNVEFGGDFTDSGADDILKSL
ncbi:peroxiredoxin-2B [Citrus sinensis]|uniref:Peroxiredoxin-2B n=1 Tax=Citrus sinensis TaxID=2711 RepID=A0ACB8I1Z6_CITSI|nr:peroxiredoxin-2B [Citrus sinensis]